MTMKMHVTTASAILTQGSMLKRATYDADSLLGR
jgi:hypothetical protein